MKIATTLSDIREYELSEEETVDIFADAGFKYLDYSFYDVLNIENHHFMSSDWKNTIQKTKKAADARGVKFIQAHAPAGKILGDGAGKNLVATERSIRACGMLGIKNMVIHSGFFDEYKYPMDMMEYFRANKPFFRALVPLMEEFGVNILFENTTEKHCPGNFYFPRNAEDLNALVEFMDHPLFGAAWDVGHANMDGLSQHDEIVKLGKNLKALHVHDNLSDRDAHTAPFLGNLDFDSLMCGLRDSGFSGYFTFEAENFFMRERGLATGGKLSRTPLAVKRASLKLLYEIGKTMLSEYGMFEE